MPTHHQTVFVTSATGTTGSALCRILIAPPLNYTVRSTTRDPSSATAQSLTALGVQFIGDGPVSWSPTHEQILLEAMKPCTKIFLCLLPNLSDLSEAPRRASLLICLAKLAGITQVVGMTSLGVFMLDNPDLTNSPYPPSPLLRSHLQAQSQIEDIITSAGFDSWTILRPGFLMANFLEPKLSSLHGGLREIRDNKTWTTCLGPSSKLGLTDHVDIARLAACAFEDPGRFNGRKLAVVSNILTVQEVLDVLGQKMGLGPAVLKAIHVDQDQVMQDKDITRAGGFFARERCLRNMLVGVDLGEAKQLLCTSDEGNEGLEGSRISAPVMSFNGFLEREKGVVGATYQQLTRSENRA